MKIANPIYDVVFKYLMEDKRVARTILSALLKKNVVEVELRPHEYSDSTRDSLSIFRIDFAATIRDNDGKESMILIEVQKTWLETETLRFRQYLGVHYSNPSNVVNGIAMPMVAIYILGHRVEDIDEPVLYVDHHCADYTGISVNEGMSSSFVKSLNHDSIIVQIPLLRGQINGRLFKILSVFDQTNKDPNDGRIISIDNETYQNDTEMNLILTRLTQAAADAKIRHHMSVEDEFFSVIEKRDTELLIKDRKLAEKQVQLDEKQEQLDEKQAQLDEKQEQLDEKQAQLDEKQAQLDEKQEQLDEKQEQLDEKDKMLGISIRYMLQAGQSYQQIATALGQDIETIKRLAQHS